MIFGSECKNWRYTIQHSRGRLYRKIDDGLMSKSSSKISDQFRSRTANQYHTELSLTTLDMCTPLLRHHNNLRYIVGDIFRVEHTPSDSCHDTRSARHGLKRFVHSFPEKITCNTRKHQCQAIANRNSHSQIRR